ncbi:MAG: ATP-binding protein [bacterium]
MWDIVIKIIIILAGVLNLFLAIFVYSRKPTERINRNYLFFGIGLFLWCFVNVILSFNGESLFWQRASYSVGNLFSFLSVFFTLSLSDKKISKWLTSLLLVICVMWSVLISFTPLLLKGVKAVTTFGFEMDYGPIFYIWGGYVFLMMIVSIIIPVSSLKTASEIKRKQLLLYLTGVIVFTFWVATVVVILPFFGIHQLNNLDSPSTLFLAGFTSYSIVKYNLLGIKSLFFQAILYSLTIIGIIAVLLLLMFVGASLYTQSMFWPLYLIAFVSAIILFLIGRVFFTEKANLENAKIDLIQLLKISERNRIIAEIERDKTLTIINSFTDGLIILNEKKEIISINPEAEKILDLKAEKIFYKSVSFLKQFSKGIMLASIFDKGVDLFIKKEINFTKDFIIELSVIPLKLEKEDIGRLIILHDISREKLVERMKTEFVSLAAHQLRTPLSIVGWSTSMLRHGDFGNLAEKQSEVIDGIYQANGRMIALVNNLLDITRIEEGKYLSNIVVTDMKDVVVSVLESYKNEIKRKNIIIKFDEPEKLPKIMVDVEKIKLAVQNLIDNAIKYSEKGNKVSIDLIIDGKNMIFKMQDAGIGIPKEQQVKIFTKFFRGDNARKVDPSGSGLGLFLSENIINAHGGKMWFESKEGVGTIFYFSLPV